MHSKRDVGVAQQIAACLRHAGDIPANAAERSCLPGGARPAGMLLAVPALVRPGCLLEVAFCAAVPGQ